MTGCSSLAVGDEDAWAKFPELWAKALGPQRTHLHMKSLRFSSRASRRCWHGQLWFQSNAD